MFYAKFFYDRRLYHNFKHRFPQVHTMELLPIFRTLNFGETVTQHVRLGFAGDESMFKKSTSVTL